MKRRGAALDGQRLVSDLASLPSLTRDALMGRWREVYGSEPPARLGRDLLMRAIAYRLQERAEGDLSASARRTLAQAVEDGGTNRAEHASLARQVKPGARLLREWHGVTHEVVILDDGVLFRGKRCRSLSEVARMITGSRWSGPTFFGLKIAGKGKVS
jgi:hypothetical protein